MKINFSGFYSKKETKTMEIKAKTSTIKKTEAAFFTTDAEVGMKI